jgi:hypothetical protein
MDYGIDAINGLIDSRSGQQISPDRAELSAAAQDSDLPSDVAQGSRYPASQRARASGYQECRGAHLRASFAFSGYFHRASRHFRQSSSALRSAFSRGSSHM